MSCMYSILQRAVRVRTSDIAKKDKILGIECNTLSLRILLNIYIYFCPSVPLAFPS